MRIAQIAGLTPVYPNQNPVEPTLSQTFSLYGITAFDVQYWTGSAWATVPNGSVTGNNKVWRQFTFSSITTSKIRVVVNAGADNVFSRVVEVEAWTGASVGSGVAGSVSNINWLVTDQLGTPRMVFDQSGSLATTKRHDYAPFGEELLNGARPTTGGYASGDMTRQKFTDKERDNETGLDYFLARYYSPTQGRFTSADPICISTQQVINPQSWNLYNYVNNNPLAYLDPTGMERVRLGQHSDEEIDKLRKEKEQQIKQGTKDGTLTKEQEKTLKAERNTLGLEKEGNKLAKSLIDKLPASEKVGLQVSDFTLTTDPTGGDFMSDSRFMGNAGPDPQGLANAAGTKAMFRMRGYSQEIFINTTATNIKDMMSGDRDWITYGATLLKHEQSHRDKNYNEFQAYSEQKRVLEQFGAGAFSSPAVYEEHLNFINRNIEKNRPKP